ncbi:MAG TPA: 30S ribosomal protein S6 [Candidatus Paceibacterota bacterium]|nr:30S ribosomal protein S6 [Candidatus Paceibacterota bacterium]
MANAEEMKIYEIGYLLVPYLSTRNTSSDEVGGPGEVSYAVEKSIKAKILASGGEITSEMDPVMTRLAYVITMVINNKHTKFSDGYFGALRFKALPTFVAILEKELAKDDMVIRSLIISLPKGSENIVTPRRAQAPRHDEQPFEIERIMPAKEEEKEALTTEELDKEIDKLVETDA